MLSLRRSQPFYWARQRWLSRQKRDASGTVLPRYATVLRDGGYIIIITGGRITGGITAPTKQALMSRRQQAAPGAPAPLCFTEAKSKQTALFPVIAATEAEFWRSSCEAYRARGTYRFSAWDCGLGITGRGKVLVERVRVALLASARLVALSSPVLAPLRMGLWSTLALWMGLWPALAPRLLSLMLSRSAGAGDLAEDRA